MLDEREIKKQIRAFQRVKNKARVGTVTRRDMNRRIRELNEKLENLYGDITPEKQELMDKIYEAKPNLKRLKPYHQKIYA